MVKIVIAEVMNQGAVEGLRTDYDIIYDESLFQQPAELHREMADADGLIVRNRTQVDLDLLAASPSLRAIGRLGVGLDNIDLEACAARNIPVLPATGANDVSVAEYVIGAALHLLRPMFRATPSILAGEWPRGRFIGQEIAGKRLGLVGYGSIARVLARKAAALDLTIAAYDPNLGADNPAWGEVERVSDLPTLLRSSDILSLHVPLLPATRNLIDGDALACMKPGSVLINAARGGVVDEEALVMALKEGRLKGAALDVLATEPPSGASTAKFAGLDNLLLTPHVAGPTEQSDIRVSNLTAKRVRDVLNNTG